MKLDSTDEVAPHKTYSYTGPNLQRVYQIFTPNHLYVMKDKILQEFVPSPISEEDDL